MSIAGLDPDVVQELRDLGYRVTTVEEAYAAVKAALGLTGLTAGVYLTGKSDLVELDAAEGASGGVSATDGNEGEAGTPDPA